MKEPKIEIDLGENLNSEFANYWQSKKGKGEVFDQIDIAPGRKRAKDSFSFAVPTELIISVGSIIGTTLLSEVVKTFWKELIEFVKNKKIESVRVTIQDRSEVIARKDIESVLDSESYYNI